MKLDELVKSKEFLDTKEKVRGWRARLEKADANEALRVRDEKAAFFGGLKKSTPDLYAAFPSTLMACQWPTSCAHRRES